MGFVLDSKLKGILQFHPGIRMDKKGVVFVRFLSSAMRYTVLVVSTNREQDPLEV